MNNVKHLINLIEKNNENWLDILEEKPYNLKIKFHKDDDNLVIFSYNMIESNFNLPEVRASRGLILALGNDEITVVCHAFDKFFNYGESHADKIDWNTSYMREKIDGSIIKLYWWNNKWNWATNNGFDAQATLQSFSPVVDEPGTRNAKTFQDLIDYAITKQFIDWNKLSKKNTYIFELTGPRNRVVVPYEETSLWLLGARDNVTDQEYHPEEISEFNQTFHYPKKLETKDLETIVATLETLDATHEGYVVVDENFNRIKCKAAAYLACHRMKDNNGQFTYKSLFETVFNNTQDDVKSYFPETVSYIEKIETEWKLIQADLKEALEYLLQEWLKISLLPPYNLQKKKYAAIVLPEYQWCQKAAFDLCNDITIDEAIKRFLSKIDYDKFVSLTDFKE